MRNMFGAKKTRPGSLRTVACLALVAALALLTAPAAGASVTSLSATLDGGGFSSFSQTNVLRGTLTMDSSRVFNGSYAARATYDGSGENGYSRGIWNVEWNDGDDVWFGGAYYLPTGFIASIQGQVDLVRWDNWSTNPTDTDWGGVSIYGSDHRARLLRFGAGRPNDTLVGPFDLPEGRWFTLEVHQRRSATSGSALSELYLDGKLVGESTAANTYGRAATRVRYGIVAIAAGAQKKPLELSFDDAFAGTASHFGGTTQPAPEPTPTPSPEPTPTPEPTPAPEPTSTPAPAPETSPEAESTPLPAEETTIKKHGHRRATRLALIRSKSGRRHSARCHRGGYRGPHRTGARRSCLG